MTFGNIHVISNFKVNSKEDVNIMKLRFNFEFDSILSGFIIGTVLFGDKNYWWLLAAVVILTSVEVKGWPYVTVKYDSDEGFSVNKGKYGE